MAEPEPAFALNFILLLLGLLIPVAGLVALGALWMVRGRDPGVKAGAPMLDTPPSDLPAPLVGTLLDEHADEHDVVAALVDLANRGVLRIAPVQETAPVPGWTADYEITRLTSDDAGLRDYERQLLSQLLGDQTSVRLSAARQRFVAALPYLQEALSEAVAREGLFAENPARVRQRWLQAGIALLVLAAAGGLFFGGWLAAYADLAFAPFIGIGILGAALLLPRRPHAAAHAPPARWRPTAGTPSAATWPSMRRRRRPTARRISSSATCPMRSCSASIEAGSTASPRRARRRRPGTAARPWSSAGPSGTGGPAGTAARGTRRTRQGATGRRPGQPRARTREWATGRVARAACRASATAWTTCSTGPPRRSTRDSGVASGSHDWSSGGSGDGGGWSGGGAGDFGGGGDSGGGGGGGGSFD